MTSRRGETSAGKDRKLGATANKNDRSTAVSTASVRKHPSPSLDQAGSLDGDTQHIPDYG